METVCVYHSIDLDGWMSAAIVKYWFNSTVEIPNKKDEPINTLEFIGYNYGQPIPDFSKYDKVIMVDISFRDSTMQILKELCKEFIWIDHHISSIKDSEEYHYNDIKGLRNTKYAACELTWNFFFPDEPMPEIVRLLGRYDCFGHKQVWKSIVGYEGLYEVSNHGNVRSLDRVIVENNTKKERLIKGVTLSAANSKRGYRVVVLCKDGTEKMRNVHQLVAESFISNPENKHCINHKDFNRLNNHVDNLEWCTYAENNLHSIEEGKKGRTVIQFTKDGEFVQQFDSIKRAESHTGIASQNISKVCKGERESAGEYKWEYGVDKDVFPQFVPEDEETKVLEFQYGARQCIKNIEEAFHWLVVNVNKSIEEQLPYVNSILEKGTAIYNYLKTEAQQVYEKGFEIRLFTYTDEDHMNPHRFICINKERFNPINFGIDYHKDGYDGCASFYFDGQEFAISLYNDNGLVDCSAIAKELGGGGHRGASGFRISPEGLTNFLRLNR